MVRIKKSTIIPQVLVETGIPEKTSLCAQYDADPAGYDAGTKGFVIETAIYGQHTVKKQLMDDQHQKCCFCEADFTANSYGDVEHFRPKGGYSTTLNGPLTKPGYYWLAYVWDNLLFSCERCNRSHKKNFFPLEDESQRAGNHTHDLTLEKPLLINPLTDDPEKHIRFNQHVPQALDIKGKTSIEGYGLDRQAFNRAREQRYSLVRSSITLAKINLDTITQEQKDQLSESFSTPWTTLEELIVKAKELVATAAHDNQPFTLMIRSNFPELPRS